LETGDYSGGFMLRALTLAIILLLTIPVTDALAAPVSCDHYRSVSRYLAAKERREAKYRKLRQRYLAWRQWRADDVRERVHRWAVHEIGTCESGYNYLPRYDAYGVFWCALYVSFCVSKGEDGHPLPANPASTSSWRAAIRSETRGLRQVHERANVLPGDIVCFPYGHTGIVHRPTGSGFWAIEGNCTDAVRLRWHAWGEADTFGRVLFTKIPERFQCVMD
jgi:hypothetical protein